MALITHEIYVHECQEDGDKALAVPGRMERWLKGIRDFFLSDILHHINWPWWVHTLHLCSDKFPLSSFLFFLPPSPVICSGNPDKIFSQLFTYISLAAYVPPLIVFPLELYTSLLLCDLWYSFERWASFHCLCVHVCALLSIYTLYMCMICACLIKNVFILNAVVARIIALFCWTWLCLHTVHVCIYILAGRQLSCICQRVVLTQPISVFHKKQMHLPACLPVPAANVEKLCLSKHIHNICLIMNASVTCLKEKRLYSHTMLPSLIGTDCIVWIELL